MVGSLRSPDKTSVLPSISNKKPIWITRRQLYASIIKILLILLSLTFAWQLLQIYSTDDAKHRRWISPEEAQRIFLSVPDAQSAIQASCLFTKEPHTAGTDGDFKTAKNYLAIIQQELGILPPDQYPLYPAGSSKSRNATLSIPHLTSPTAWIDQYYPILNYPLDRVVEIVDDDGHIIWSANLEEVADKEDPDAHNAASAAPAYCAYSPNADVTGKLVYAHYGRYQDFADLIARGVDLKGAVVIARYGGISRGLKAKRAQELGAIALLVYNDINDDGTVTPEQGYEPYPKGPARNPTSVQRGSVHFMSVMAGDMSTPGYPAYENATRVDVFAAPDIPVLPISWLNAQILLKETEGGGRRIHVSNHGENKITPIWNVMGVIPGHIGNEIVILGNHRDSWATGGTDPSSGTSSMHEVIRGFGELLRAGWKPLRTVVIASWDAEEFSVIGSTEWCEDFADFLGTEVKVVAYVNVDSSAAGSRFRAGASPSLSHIYRDVAQSLDHPTDKDRTLWDGKKDNGKLMGNKSAVVEQEAEEFWRPLRDSRDSVSIRAVDKLGVSALGSGSDFTPFLAYLGIASVNTGFSSTLHDPVWHYHSIFDTHTWQERFGDPGFKRHIAISKFMGLLALHLSGDYVVPLNTTHYTLELDGYLEKIATIANSSSININLSPLRAAINNLQNASSELDIEKTEAEQELEHALQQWHKSDTLWAHIKCKVKSWLYSDTYHRLFGRGVSEHASPTASEYNSADFAAATIKKHPRPGKRIQPRIGHAGGVARRRRRQVELELAHAFGESYGVDIARRLSSPDRGHNHYDGRLKALVKAIKRVQVVNAKLIAFERGFVSPEGLPERPFYRHLGVAPGRYLGYGATPLPGVYEALVFEADVGAAENEAVRLAALMDRLAERLRA